MTCDSDQKRMEDTFQLLLSSKEPFCPPKPSSKTPSNGEVGYLLPGQKFAFLVQFCPGKYTQSTSAQFYCHGWVLCFKCSSPREAHYSSSVVFKRLQALPVQGFRIFRKRAPFENHHFPFAYSHLTHSFGSDSGSRVHSQCRRTPQVRNHVLR